MFIGSFFSVVTSYSHSLSVVQQKETLSVELISSDTTDVLRKEYGFWSVTASVWVCSCKKKKMFLSENPVFITTNTSKKQKALPYSFPAKDTCAFELWSHLPAGLRDCKHHRQEEMYKKRVGGEREVYITIAVTKETSIGFRSKGVIISANVQGCLAYHQLYRENLSR